MSDIKTNFSVGDSVFLASTFTERKQHPCPDCKGSRRWTAKSPAGGAYEFSCPRCSHSYMSNDALSLNYTSHEPSVKGMTIGSVRTDTNDKEPNSYMCVETGVGSGSIYRESVLFSDKEDAQRAAEIDARRLNVETDWVVTQYNKTLSLSDYEIENAALKDARDMTISRSVRLQMLFEDLRDAENIEEVNRTVDEFSFEEA